MTLCLGGPVKRVIGQALASAACGGYASGYAGSSMRGGRRSGSSNKAAKEPRREKEGADGAFPFPGRLLRLVPRLLLRRV